MLGFGAVVDTEALIEVIWVSLLAGVGVTAVFSLALLGATRSGEARRAGRGASAVGFGALGVLAGVALVAGVAYAVHLIVTG